MEETEMSSDDEYQKLLKKISEESKKGVPYKEPPGPPLKKVRPQAIPVVESMPLAKEKEPIYYERGTVHVATPYGLLDFVSLPAANSCLNPVYAATHGGECIKKAVGVATTAGAATVKATQDTAAKIKAEADARVAALKRQADIDAKKRADEDARRRAANQAAIDAENKRKQSALNALASSKPIVTTPPATGKKDIYGKTCAGDIDELGICMPSTAEINKMTTAAITASKAKAAVSPSRPQIIPPIPVVGSVINLVSTVASDTQKRIASLSDPITSSVSAGFSSLTSRTIPYTRSAIDAELRKNSKYAAMASRSQSEMLDKIMNRLSGKKRVK